MGNEPYALYVGDFHKTISLWKREDGKEYPIFANTRGQPEWYSISTDVYENTTPTNLSDEFVEWLAHFYRARNGLLDSDSMFLADMVEEDQPDEDPKWYEIEILNEIGKPDYTPEQEDLLEWAYNEVENDE